jgi:L-seryl-tRNA(Ser) seleniumtransferase
VLAMLTRSAEALHTQAAELAKLAPSAYRAELKAGESAVGGGSFPGATLPTTLVVLDPGPLGANGLALRLRLGDPAVVARVEEERVLLDSRTLQAGDVEVVVRALRAVIG